MSNFTRLTRHPVTGELHDAEWLDNHFGRHQYGIRFDGEGKTYTEKEVFPTIEEHQDEDEKRALFERNLGRLEAINVYATACLAGMCTPLLNRETGMFLATTGQFASVAFGIAEAMQAEYEKRKEAIK